MIIDLEILDQALTTYLFKNKETDDSTKLIDEVNIEFLNKQMFIKSLITQLKRSKKVFYMSNVSFYILIQ